MEGPKRGVAIALLQEPYVGASKSMKGYRGVRIFQSTNKGDRTVKAAIAVFQNDITITQFPKITTNNCCVIGITTSAWEITLGSYYFEPDTPITPYLQHLQRISDKVGSERWIAGGDANAKSTWWGSEVVDARGRNCRKLSIIWA